MRRRRGQPRGRGEGRRGRRSSRAQPRGSRQPPWRLHHEWRERFRGGWAVSGWHWRSRPLTSASLVSRTPRVNSAQSRAFTCCGMSVSATATAGRSVCGSPILGTIYGSTETTIQRKGVFLGCSPMYCVMYVKCIHRCIAHHLLFDYK